jgi:hypothetical protein
MHCSEVDETATGSANSLVRALLAARCGSGAALHKVPGDLVCLLYFGRPKRPSGQTISTAREKIAERGTGPKERLS